MVRDWLAEVGSEHGLAVRTAVKDQEVSPNTCENLSRMCGRRDR
jgi:hypothetical protein